MKTTIVLADDHRIVCDGLSLLLQSQGNYRVVATAANGLDALRAVEEKQPDIAIFDVCMPNINGIAAAEQAVTRAPSTRVIILSMYAERSYVLQALRVGVRGYVLKESAADDLLSAIEIVMNGHRYLSRRLTDMLVDHYIAQPATNPTTVRHNVRLNSNERRVLQLITEGHSSAQIGKTLGLATSTVDTYRSRIMQKFRVNSTIGLIKFAFKHDLIST